MWFQLGIENLIAKKIIHDDCFELYINDFARIWHTCMTDGELVSVSQRLNPLFEASVQKLKEIISNLFQDEKAIKEITKENNNIILKLKSDSLGVKFLFQIVLHQQNEEIFYKEFTLPFLLTFLQVQNREKMLIKIIADKDAEIEEYKQEYGVIKSRFVATEPFSIEKFESQELNTKIVDSNSFFECINLILPKIKKEQSSCENVADKHIAGSSQKFTDNKKTIFIDINNKNGPNQCVRLEHQTIKRRKKQSDVFKIKF